MQPLSRGVRGLYAECMAFQMTTMTSMSADSYCFVPRISNLKTFQPCHDALEKDTQRTQTIKLQSGATLSRQNQEYQVLTATDGRPRMMALALTGCLCT